ncbi:hypothetical protein HY450_01725 [Candidatus Pacearchaeota archaeon]|nr:hypothetical protein [Candidatus Pacearchaeota archaeon]
MKMTKNYQKNERTPDFVFDELSDAIQLGSSTEERERAERVLFCKDMKADCFTMICVRKQKQFWQLSSILTKGEKFRKWKS